MSTEVGWDGCPPCFGCAICLEAQGDCCGDCMYDSLPYFSHPHGAVCATCRCSGSTAGVNYTNLECNCEHDCGG